MAEIELTSFLSSNFSKIMIYYVRVYLTALVPLCYPVIFNFGDRIFLFILKNNVHPAEQVQSRKIAH